MNDWVKQYAWSRTWARELDLNGKPLEDYVGYDGNQYIGRIRLETAGPTKGRWQWSGAYPRLNGRTPIMPNAGYSATAADAAKAVEEYWDAMKVKT